MNTSKSTSFTARVLSLLAKIPKGKVTTHKELAKALGKPNASRAVGNALHRNKKPNKFPCFKVVRNDGSIGGYSLGRKEKLKRLKKEGIFAKNGKIDITKHLFKFDKNI